MGLEAIDFRAVPRKQQLALLRLQLRFTGETHRLYRGFGQWLVGVIGLAADRDGTVDGVRLFGSLVEVEQRWRGMHRQWAGMLERAREEAASIPFGALVIYHNHYFRPFAGTDESTRTVEERWIGPQEIGQVIRLWERRRQRALDQAAARIYSDGFNLSGRVWRLENGGVDELRRVLATALAGRTNAAALSRLVEGQLGVGQECPRWTYTRLYRMAPPDRLVDQTGLLRGDECDSRGLAYKALRMARNEIQIAHHRMTDDILAHSPWVEGEQIRLSAQHPEPDICDDYANGGPYEAGEVQLPLHVQCMCFKEAVVMAAAAFRGQVRGWLAGENSFLDDYAEWSGVREPMGLDWAMPIAQSLELWLEMAADGHAEALGL